MQEEHLLVTIEMKEMMGGVMQEVTTSQDTIGMMIEEVIRTIEQEMIGNITKMMDMKGNIKARSNMNLKMTLNMTLKNLQR